MLFFHAGTSALGVLKTCTFVRTLLLMDVTYVSVTAIVSIFNGLYLFNRAQVLITPRSEGSGAVSDILNADRVTFVLLYEGRCVYVQVQLYIRYYNITIREYYFDKLRILLSLMFNLYRKIARC